MCRLRFRCLVVDFHVRACSPTAVQAEPIAEQEAPSVAQLFVDSWESSETLGEQKEVELPSYGRVVKRPKQARAAGRDAQRLRALRARQKTTASTETTTETRALRRAAIRLER